MYWGPNSDILHIILYPTKKTGDACLMFVTCTDVFDDPDDVYWCWEKLYSQILDDHAPIISFKKSKTPGSQFITTDIQKTRRQRDRFKRKFNKSRSPDDWENYRRSRNKVVSMRRKAVKERFTKLCEETHGNQRKFWGTISPYINSCKNINTGQIILKDNGKLIGG